MAQESPDREIYNRSAQTKQHTTKFEPPSGAQNHKGGPLSGLMLTKPLIGSPGAQVTYTRPTAAPHPQERPPSSDGTAFIRPMRFDTWWRRRHHGLSTLPSPYYPSSSPQLSSPQYPSSSPRLSSP